MIVVLATSATQDKIANYLNALLWVYTILIFAYIVSSLIFSMGARVPYNRWSNAILSFLRDVCEPYLRIFRRFIPMVGPLDLSPIVAIFVLRIVGGIIVTLIRG